MDHLSMNNMFVKNNKTVLLTCCRYNEISGSVSHVVMGEMTEEHVRLLQQTEHR